MTAMEWIRSNPKIPVCGVAEAQAWAFILKRRREARERAETIRNARLSDARS